MKVTPQTAGATAAASDHDRWRVALVYVVAVLALELVASVSPAPLGIAAWRPAHALGLALLMTKGLRYCGVVFLTMLASEFLLHGPAQATAGAITAAAGTAGYALAAKVLREEVDFDARLPRLRDVLVLVVVVVAAAMAVTALQLAVRATAGSVPWDVYTAAAFRAWASDVIGILSVAPALLLHRPSLSQPGRWRVLVRPEALATLLVICGFAWLLFGPLHKDAFKAFYLLFLPLLWIGLRHGLAGASLAIVATNASLDLITRAGSGSDLAPPDVQLLMLALTVTNLVLGAIVSERRHAETWLSAHQAELAHAARVSATGEMASALAHELNQPLAATITYIRACQLGLRQRGGDAEMLELMDKAAAQAERASRVVRGVRAFLRKDESPRALADPRTLITEATALTAAEAAQYRVQVRTQFADDLPLVLIDAIQIQQVIVNLVRNAIEAVAAGGGSRRTVTVAAWRGDDMVEIAVVDSGPGLAPHIAEKLFMPFNTSKATGMGLGLAIARSIVEAHGGRLVADQAPSPGMAFRFGLPIAQETAGE